MKKQELMKQWLSGLYEWPSEEILDATNDIMCNLEPEAEHILNYFKETGNVIAPEGDFPSVDAIRKGNPGITEIAIISLYDALLKFDLKRPQK